MREEGINFPDPEVESYQKYEKPVGEDFTSDRIDEARKLRRRRLSEI